MTQASEKLSYSLERPTRPLLELLSLALPTVAQMASYTVMQFIDTWMLSQVDNGIDAPTAASNSGILAFAVISLGMGALWVVNTLVSQNFGRKDYSECGRYLWQGIWFALGFAALLLPALPFAPTVFHALGHEPAVARLEIAYLQIVLGASVFKLVGTALGQFLLAVNRPRQVLAATVAGVTINAIAAWTMIFGHFGAPAMGVVGAAWAQNVGVLIEMSVLVGFVFRPSIRRTFNVRDWRLRLREMRTLLKVGIPSGIQVVSEVLAWSAFTMWVMPAFGGAAGTRAMAATTFVFRYMSVSFMPAYGMSVAVTALVGRYIGKRQLEEARRRAHLGFAVAGIYMLACATLFLSARHWLIGLFAHDPDLLALGAKLLVFAAIYQCFDAMYIIYNGALRGAGDTFVPALVTGVLCWTINVLGSHAFAHLWPDFGPAGPWAVATGYGVILGFFMVARFQRGKWQSIDLEDKGAADRVFEPIVVQALQPASCAVNEQES